MILFSKFHINCIYNVFALTFLTPIFPLVQLIQYINNYISLDKGSYISMKDLTMSPLSDEGIGIIFGRNWVQRKISMKMLAQKRCKSTFAGNLEKHVQKDYIVYNVFQ